MTSSISTDKQPWELYQQIEATVLSRCEQHKVHKGSEIHQALQRLYEAVLIKHNLEETDHKQSKKFFLITVDSCAVKKMKFSTISEMIHARIPEWEDAIESTPATPDGMGDWHGGTDGREAGYYHKYSLDSELIKRLGQDYFTIETILNTTPLEAWKIYKTVEKVVLVERDRLASSSASQRTSQEKVEEINQALTRLCQAVLCKYQLEKPADCTFQFNAKIEQDHFVKIDLYSNNSMLDAKIQEVGYPKSLSLREVLNIARSNFFNLSCFEGMGPLWGKTRALENVEAALKDI
ncbi:MULTISPECIES: hypothetical protein [Parachlamydia]|jgi:hypothetical protein|uniref:hypothetical protein n=1 Tax=Parachlamydia TaxID=83551 RepID=UPI0001C17929|nr:hypothetical protein [Parachlamydia acanthamoebae]EFB40826.1 hypothetical protein pah_c180o001 [Parachlamydia acanthamoebae str. Hall's coccus]